MTVTSPPTTRLDRLRAAVDLVAALDLDDRDNVTIADLSRLEVVVHPKTVETRRALFARPVFAGASWSAYRGLAVCWSETVVDGVHVAVFDADDARVRTTLVDRDRAVGA